MTFKTRMRRKIQRNIKTAPKGGSGIYIQLSRNRGVKILLAEYDDAKEFVTYGIHTRVRSEAINMKAARLLYPYIPAFYGIRTFKLDGFFNIGLIIQHLGRKRVIDITEDYHFITSGLEKKLRTLGIYHNDIHSHNVMYFRQKYWVIDFAHVSIKPN